MAAGGGLHYGSQMTNRFVTLLSTVLIAFAVLVPSLALASSMSEVTAPASNPKTAVKDHAQSAKGRNNSPDSELRAASNARAENRGDHTNSGTAADWMAARAARDAANSARDMNRISIAGLVVGLATTVAAGAAAYFAWRASDEARRSANAAVESHGAFVAAEDAALSVSFPNGGKIEAMTEGVLTTYFDVNILLANIGRSAAQIEGWRFGEAQNEQLHVVEPGQQWGGFREITMTIRPNEEFTVTIIYSTPIRQKQELDVTAELRLIREPNGLERISAITRKTYLRQVKS